MIKIFKRHKPNDKKEIQDLLENNILKEDKTFNLKESIIKLPSNFRTDVFYPMNMIPPRNENEPFSVLVIVYDKDDCKYFNIGYYNYELEKWEIFDVEIMNLKCWCYAPNPSKYWNEENFITVSVNN